MDTTLQQALRQLDTANDEHWTEAGLPSLDAIAATLGRTATRKEVSAFAPDLTRDTFADWLGALDEAAQDDEQEAAEADNAEADNADRAAMDANIEALRVAVQEAGQAVAKAESDLKRAEHALDKAITERTERYPPTPETVAIKEHIERLRAHKLAAIGATPANPKGLSPIDATLRGRKRTNSRTPNTPMRPALVQA